MVESLARRGLEVTLVGRSSHLLGDFDRTFAAPVYNAMRHCGVALNLAQSVQGLAGDSGRITHVETDVERLQADMVLVATGQSRAQGWPGLLDWQWDAAALLPSTIKCRLAEPVYGLPETASRSNTW